MTLTPLRAALARIDRHDVRPEVALGEVRGMADAADAHALLDVVEALPAVPWGRPTASPLRSYVSVLRRPLSEEATEVVRGRGVALLEARLGALLAADPGDVDAAFLVNTIALFGTEAIVAATVLLAANQPDCESWPVILGHLEGAHPHADAVVAALAHPLPGGFVEVALLDLVNNLQRAGRAEPHVFDTDEGRGRLAMMLESDDPEAYSLAHSAAAALPFLGAGATRDTLLASSLDHPDGGVRAEAAWAAARLGDPRGIPLLVGLCAEPQTAWRAERYLEELGAAEHIPDAVTQPDFRACMQMSEWLEHPQEYGRPPSSVEVVWSGTLFWPPTGDRRRMSVVRYRYDDGDGAPDEGQGLVGHITFAMLGEASAAHTPLEVLALHCAWETLVGHHDTAGAPTLEDGLAMLRVANPDGGLP